jgi:hypothetical protein
MIAEQIKPDQDTMQVIGEGNLFSIIHKDFPEVPIMANCPGENLEKTKRMFSSDFYILMHTDKYNMQWVFR